MSAPVLSREQAVTRLSACVQEIRELGVVRLALFGSVLRGDTHAESDVGVLELAQLSEPRPARGRWESPTAS